MPRDPLASLHHLHADAATARPGGRTARVGEAVMDATLAELSEHGYAALRVDRVAERAGVNKTTVYRRWGTKSGLVTTALLERTAEMVPPPDTGTLRGDIVALLREIRASLRTPWIAALVRELGPRRDGGDGVHEVLDRLWPHRFRSSRVIFTRAQERGELSAAADPDFLTEAISAPMYFRYLMLGRTLSDAFLEHIADQALHGMLGPTPPDKAPARRRRSKS